MERDLLEREVRALHFNTAMPDFAPAYAMESEVALQFEEGYFNYGTVTEKSFLREKDQATYQKLDGKNIFFLQSNMVYIWEENAGWLLVEGSAYTEKNGLPVNRKGWIKKSWVKIKQPVKLVASNDEREFKLEFQTYNYVRRTDGKSKAWLPRKYGPALFLHKGTRGKPATAGKEGTAVELQSETDGYVEFETPKWFRDWCELKERIEDAVGMITTINKLSGYKETLKETWDDGTAKEARVIKFPFDIEHLRISPPWAKKFPSFKGLTDKEYLELAIVDSDWYATIQVSEAIELTQYQSLLEEHVSPDVVAQVTDAAAALVTLSNVVKLPPGSLVNLQSFLQIIIFYILSGKNISLKKPNGSRHPSKFAFRLMCRTSFSSIFRVLLTDDEKTLFRQIVQQELILKNLSVKGSQQFFVNGHGTSRTRPSLSDWLKSILSPIAGKDLLSHSTESKKLGGFNGSAAMGKFDIVNPTDKIRFEARGSQTYGNNGGAMVQPVADWVSFIEKIFKESNKRRNNGKGKQLKYDPAKC